MSWEIKQGDWIEVLRSLPDESVQCVVTSPPYWGLRDYGVSGQLGLERTPEEYVAKMVEGFREVRRVLRSDGTLWLNLGDSYNAHPGQRTVHDKAGYKQSTNRGSCEAASRNTPDMKAKDLVGIPWMLAFALRADGWWLRQDIIWAKPNPMPESVTDRCTKSHEYIFLLTKSERYYYDAEAIKEDAVADHPSGNGFKRDARLSYLDDNGPRGNDEQWTDVGGKRNKRSVWEVATSPFPEAHFATFPPKLVGPCILAGTSERGCCAKCGAPWERIVERYDTGQRQKMADGWDTGEGGHGTIHRNGREQGEPDQPVMAAHTLGWQPTCECGADTVPCTVLDPFSGAGTTGLVATRFHRNYLGIELNSEYVAMAQRRIQADAPLLNTQGRGHETDESSMADGTRTADSQRRSTETPHSDDAEQAGLFERAAGNGAAQ